ncbi:hypothetical protein J2732_001971 [Achromobacter deleyi]|uniref:hypothetical protein n=1 Tax=Achromobacter deleyi TaxID=1353891 RepID=UPI00285765C9|nr:hypothetical protein [Achromobacter deleyi]MDR6600988.1 hypothetical protein [Achromobacter deleyi]
MNQSHAPQAAEQALPSYGKLPFHQLGQDVTEATTGVRQPFDFGPNYPGHAMCLINFNSLARIVDKYRLPEASAPVAGEAQPVAWMVDWPDEPDLGHTILEDPVPGARNRALVIRDAAPQAGAAVRAESDMKEQ